MSLLSALARAARRALPVFSPSRELIRQVESAGRRDRLAYQRDVLHYLYDRRTRLDNGWVTARDVAANVGRLDFDAAAALNALVCDGFAERVGHLFRSRGVPATPGPASNVIPFPTRAQTRTFTAAVL